jgi:aryl-alcohol dehydrogenase-like predicted oxidoreductase
VPVHAEALEEALLSGVNVVDTSTNYGDGHSERMVGEVVARLVRSSKLSRAGVIVVSKIGYAQGQNLDLIEARKNSGRPFSEVVEYADGLAHCIHPEWLGDQLGRSLSRLGFETLDVCLLHNPEYFLSDAAKRGVPLPEARDEFYRRIEASFRHFETEVAKGRIRYYGVSSNTAVDPAAERDAVSVERLLQAALAAGGASHHFKVLQVPMNLLEPGAALEGNTGSDGAQTVLEYARARGLAVLLNRPLNAMGDGRLIRLADPPAPNDALPLSEAIARVRDLEAEFGKTIAPALGVPPESRTRPEDFFRWADALGNLAAELRSFEDWRDVERHQIAPRLMQTVAALDRAITGPLEARWQNWQERYLAAMEGLFRAIGRRAGDRSRARARVVSRAVDPLLPPERQSLSLSQKAILTLASVEGVTTVLVGMREKPYVADALAVMRIPKIENARDVLRAMPAVDI